MLAWYVNECEMLDPKLEKISTPVPSSSRHPNHLFFRRYLGLREGPNQQTAGTIRFSLLLELSPVVGPHLLLLLLLLVLASGQGGQVVQVQRGCLEGSSGWSESFSDPPALCSTEKEKKWQKWSLLEHRTTQLSLSYLAHQGLFLFKGSLPFCSEASRWLVMMWQFLVALYPNS